MPYLDLIEEDTFSSLSTEQNSFIGARAAMLASLRDFKSALDLFDLMVADSSKLRNREAWAKIACRDGAFQIFHFTEALKLLCIHANANRSTIDHSDLLDIRRAKKIAATAFPAAKFIRDAIGHFGQFAADPSQFRLHMLEEEHSFPDGSTAFAGTLNDGLVENIYTTTYQGRLLSFTMSKKVHHQQLEICNLVAPLTTAHFLLAQI